MNKMQRQVEEFHEAMNMTVGLTPELRDHELRAKLILEEAVETVAAMGFAAHAGFSEPYGPDDYQPDDIASFHKLYQQPDDLEVIDGLCDLLYVVFGAAVTMGIDLQPFFEEVHKANMLKSTGPKRADGKQLKPEGWQPPDHGPLLEKQITRAMAWQKAIEETEGEWLHPQDPGYPFEELEARPVHNHGTEDGPGIGCREQIIDGALTGDCLVAA